MTALGVVSSLSGGRSMSSKTKQYEAHVDGAEYAEVVKSYGDAVTKMFVSQIKAAQ